MKRYRLKKSLKIFRSVLRSYRKKGTGIPPPLRQEGVNILNKLQRAILDRDDKEARAYAEQATSFCLSYLKKSPYQRLRDFVLSLLIALLIAVTIRTIWFEFYEIPTGSMRPTFAEQDRLVVSKTSFGINIPLRKGHIYFDPDLVLRGGIVIFTGSNMDINNVNTLYFYLFPGKKQYIKRLMGKPGDTLYFYGGKIYGIDKNGEDISKAVQLPQLRHIDHVPYINMNGRASLPQRSAGEIYSPTILKQMNQSVAKFTLNAQNRPSGKLMPPFDKKVEDYFDLWGFRNYGMARLLTKEEVLSYTNASTSQIEDDAPLYMEIIHHPTVRYPKIMRDSFGRLQPTVGTCSSIIPLKTEHLKALFSNLYTARFVVKDGKALRYGSSMNKEGTCRYCPDLLNVPDGTYEFYYGKAYQIFMSGITKELRKDHPIYQFSPERVQFFYNLGIEFVTLYAPMAKDQPLLPSRYVYYRDGDLYTMGAPLIKGGDPTLDTFIAREYLRQKNAPSYHPYFPFDDLGAPVDQEGKVRVEFIKKHGITIPPHHYLVLGDNYAMSADSRDFGFVPEDNIRGAPSFIFYPFGKRFGFPSQAYYPFFNVPRVVVWMSAFVALLSWYIHHRKHYKLPVKIE